LFLGRFFGLIFCNLSEAWFWSNKTTRTQSLCDALERLRPSLCSISDLALEQLDETKVLSGASSVETALGMGNLATECF